MVLADSKTPTNTAQQLMFVIQKTKTDYAKNTYSYDYLNIHNTKLEVLS